jgi:arginyl-tRNA synthetase
MFCALITKELSKCVPIDTVFSVSVPDQAEHGDYSSNVAMVLAKKEEKNPLDLALEIKTKLENSQTVKKNFEKIEIAGHGFLNFYINKNAIYSALDKTFNNNTASHKKTSFFLRSKKICLEFVSANPTGPLTMANGRGGFYGDVLANILERAGHKITREYYINDTGNQVKLLGDSIAAVEGNSLAGGEDNEEFYKGEYIKELKGKSAKQAVVILLRNIKKSLKKAGINFDVWFSEEQNLHKNGELKKTLEFLLKTKKLTEFEGALWLGDPKTTCAVLIKSDGAPTYFLADLAYHYDKFIKRKFDVAINIWGADHHGYITRMKAGVEAFGVEKSRLHIIIMQLVRLMSEGKEIRMSKRAGNFVTMDELLEMVGVDAARWFFLERSNDTHMDFNLDLAREHSKKNPVHYVQYAHARACSILNKSSSRKSDFQQRKSDFLKLLVLKEELALIKKILQLSEVIEDIATDYQVQRLPKYAYELAQSFTEFYENCKVIDPNNKELTMARLALVKVAQITIKDALSLMGISAPKKM